MPYQHNRTEHGRASAENALLLLKHKPERNPFGKDWNATTTEGERRFWLRSVGHPENLAKLATWAELPEVTREALLAGLMKCAGRARYLLQVAAA